MKKVIISLLFAFIFASAAMAEKAYMDVYVSGKDTGHRIIADISMPDMSVYGKDHLVWHQIYIVPVRGKNDVGLTSQLYSIDNGSITNLNISRNKITFRIDLTYDLPAVETGERYMDVVITTKPDGSSIDDISAISQWTDLQTNRIFNVQWKKSSRHYFKLPYNIVF